MAADEEFVSAQLKKLKNLFSKFVAIENDINHEINGPGHNDEMGANQMANKTSYVPMQSGDTMLQKDSAIHNNRCQLSLGGNVPFQVTTCEKKINLDCNRWNFSSIESQLLDGMSPLSIRGSHTTFATKYIAENSINTPASSHFNLNVNSTADNNVTLASFDKESDLDCSLWNKSNIESQVLDGMSPLSIRGSHTTFATKYIAENSINTPASSHFNLNVNSTADGNVTLASFDKESDLDWPLWNSSNIESQVACEFQPIVKNQTMGVRLPVESDFTESGLEYLNNKTSHTILTNYFYYLFDGNNMTNRMNYVQMPSGDTILQKEHANVPVQVTNCENKNNLDCNLWNGSNIGSHVLGGMGQMPMHDKHATFGTTYIADNSINASDENVTSASFDKGNDLDCNLWNCNIESQTDESQPIPKHQVMGIDTNELIFIESGLEHLNEADAPCRNENPEYTIEQEYDDGYDEKVFESATEKSDDFSDVEVSQEGSIDFHFILATLTAHKSDDVILMSSQGMKQNDSVSAESQNHSVLNIRRLAGSCDNNKMFVKTSDQKRKKLCCPYCTKLYCKLPVHVEMMHKDEPAVQKLRTYPKGSKMRRMIQDAIRKVGTWKWNTDPTLNNGELIVSRRPHPKLNKKATDYLTCPNCTGVYTITNIRNHFSDCTKQAFKGIRNIKILSRAVEGRFSSEANSQLQEVIPVMRSDSIVDLIRYDWLLVVYGNLLCLKYNHSFQQNMIRAKLRLAGRLLEAVKTINTDVTDFSSIYHPKRYKSLIEAIKVVGRYDLVTNEFGTPATAASAVTSIKQIGSILKCEYIEREESHNVKRTEDFLYLMESQFTSIINKRVKESQLQKKRERDHKIPSKEDVRKLSLFLNRERNICFEELSANFSTKTWIKLSELTIGSIIVFNRRRVGESQNALVSDFERRETVDETSNQELFAALSEDSKKVAQRFSRMKVRGKKGTSNVNVLLKADVTSCIELLLHHREKVGITPQNKFLFALPSPPGDKRIKVVNASKVLTSYSVKCGAKDPSTLRGTNLRKHFASKCMAMELNDDMVSEVARFMGHAELVHRKYYRHNTIDREIVKIAKLLEAAQGIEEDDGNDSGSDSSDSVSDDEGQLTASKSALKGDNKNSEKTSSVQKLKKISGDRNRSKRKLYSDSTTTDAGQKIKSIEKPRKTAPAVSAGQKRKKMYSGNQRPKKKFCATSINGSECVLEAVQKRTTNSKNIRKTKLSTTSAKSVSRVGRKHN